MKRKLIIIGYAFHSTKSKKDQKQKGNNYVWRWWFIWLSWKLIVQNASMLFRLLYAVQPNFRCAYYFDFTEFFFHFWPFPMSFIELWEFKIGKVRLCWECNFKQNYISNLILNDISTKSDQIDFWTTAKGFKWKAWILHTCLLLDWTLRIQLEMNLLSVLWLFLTVFLIFSWVIHQHYIFLTDEWSKIENLKNRRTIWWAM